MSAKSFREMSFKHLKYYPELNPLTGSINATIILLQLEYWFTKCKGDKFYKFLDVCEHEQYKQGDSWVEELGFTKHEFRTAFTKIGKAYKSKREFNESQDLFGGKYYASYYDRIKGLTYYCRNDKAVADLLSNCLAEKESLEDKKDNQDLQRKQIKTYVNKENAFPLSVDYNKLLTSVKDTPTTKWVPYETIKELFNKCCTSFSKVTMLTVKRKTMILRLWDNMGKAVENFEKVFLLAEESDFLSGRQGSWRASFDWLLKEEKFVAVLEGAYANRSSKEKESGIQPKNKFTAMYSHNWGFEELEKLEEQYIGHKVSQLKLAAAAAAI